MIPDLTLEVIYINQPTDFKMEFELCSSSNIRFLSMAVKDRTEFLTALSKSVVRSRAIVTVGSFNPLDKLYVPKIIAKATGYELKAVEKEKFGISSKSEILLPEKSLPLLDAEGNLAGCVLENFDQTIIMLTNDRELRHKVVTDLVCPYLKLFANKKNESNLNTEKIPPVDKKSSKEELPLNTKSDRTEEPVENNPTENNPTEKNNTEINPTEKNNIEINSTEINPTEKAVDLNGFVDTKTYEESVEKPNPPKNEKPAYAVLEQPQENSDFYFGEFPFNEPENSKPSKKSRPWIKVIISIILVAVVLFLTYFGYERLYQPMQKNSVYEDTREMYGQTWAELPEDMLYKFGKLYQTNSDILGWLNIPNTNINLPVVTSANKSELYYRNHLFEGSINRYGTLYTPSAVTKGGYVRNIIIYGKDTNDGTMFSDLKEYLNIKRYQEVPTFSFDTLYLENKWKIFSVFKVAPAKEKNFLKNSFFDDEDFSSYLELLKSVSLIDTEIDVTGNDQIVTLVAQSEDMNYVVSARMVRDGESPLVDVTGSAVNDDAFSYSSTLPTIAANNSGGLTELTSDEVMANESADANMADGASSRFEQQAPVSSAISVKPTAPTISSVPEISSQFKTSSTYNIQSKNNTTSKEEQTTSLNTSKEVSSAPQNSGKLPTLTVTNNFNGQKVKGPANEIIAMILEAEMGSGYHIEALKAQAVAAYSWLLCNGSAQDKYLSAPMKTAGDRCVEAANAVAGQVAVYNGSVAQTYYYAISAGKTANSKDIWSNQLPYLVSVDSSVDKSVSGYQTVRKYTSADVAKIAKNLLGVDLTKISDKNKWFTCSYDSNGLYCTKIKIGDNIEKKGTYMRDTFFSSSRVGAANVLRSSAYKVVYSATEDKFVFTVKGYGHGVGMSQTGANAYAKNGWNYEKILKHYYTGISIGTYFNE